MDLSKLSINRASVPERKILSLMEEASTCRTNNIASMAVEPDMLLTLLYSYEMAQNNSNLKREDR